MVNTPYLYYNIGMKYKWLNKKENQELIVFFNGWGLDETVVKHLDPEEYDVLMFYDYNSLETDFDFNEISGYRKHLIAWSMGVMTASLFPNDYLTLTAINGTLRPIDTDFGINPKIYDLTIKGFNKNGIEKFIKNMFDSPVNITISRDIENQQSELTALKTYKANPNFKYTKIIISSNDKIIPTSAQERYWRQKSNIKSGHCPFFIFKKWSELL